MNSKAQINQIFVWIIVALVIGATALIGVRSIGGLLEDKCSIDKIRFKDVSGSAISLNNDFGSVNQEIISMPCDYTMACFVDARFIENKESLKEDDALEKLKPFFSIISSSVEDGVEENVFLFNQKEVIPAGYVPQIRLAKGNELPEKGFICFESRGGRITMILEGLGRNTLLRKPSNLNS